MTSLDLERQLSSINSLVSLLTSSVLTCLLYSIQLHCPDFSRYFSLHHSYQIPALINLVNLIYIIMSTSLKICIFHDYNVFPYTPFIYSIKCLRNFFHKLTNYLHFLTSRLLDVGLCQLALIILLWFNTELNLYILICGYTDNDKLQKQIKIIVNIPHNSYKQNVYIYERIHVFKKRVLL